MGVVFVLFRDSSFAFGVVDNFVLYSFIWASKTFYRLMLKIFQKNPAKGMRATLACLFTCVCFAHVF